nr:hypothetical protein [Butyrivibrio sp.]
YRIETINMDEGIPLSGYMSTVTQLMEYKLGIKRGYTAEELQAAINKSNDLDAKRLVVCLAMLCDIPVPEIYDKNRDNMYCLYGKDEFMEAVDILNSIYDIMFRTVPALSFRYKKFKLKDTEIAYEDLYQIVITKETYEKHKNDSEYKILP